MDINYITYDSWWDTDKDILPILTNHFRVRIYSIDKEVDNKYSHKEKFKSLSLNTYISGSNRSIKEIFRSFIFVLKLVVKSSKDSIFVFWIGNNVYILLFAFLFLKRSRTVIGIHNFIEHGNNNKSFYARMKKILYLKYRYFMFYSETQKELFDFKYAGKNSYHLLMPLKNFGNKTKRKNEVRTFLFFGYVSPYKRLDLFIKAAQVLQCKNVRFIIAGYTNQWEQFNKLIIDKSQFELNIRYVKDSEIPNLFSESDFLVLPYDDSTQSGPLLVAINYGIPAIATNLPIFRKWIKNKSNGFLFNVGKLDELEAIFSKVSTMTDKDVCDMKKNVLKTKAEYEKSVKVLDVYLQIINDINNKV